MKPVSCKLCSSLGGKSEYWTLDDRKTHAQFHAFQSAYISENGDRPSVKEVFGKCFPLQSFDKSENIEKSQSALMKICHRVIKTNKNESNSIECQICGSRVQYFNKKGKRADLILAHACTHSTKKPFVCRDCQHESATKSNIVDHIKSVHKIDSPVNDVHFDEYWIACFDDIKETLVKSFVRLNLDPGWRMKIRTPPSELSIQRRAIVSKILKNTNTKKTQCRRCQLEICAKCSANLEDHIRSHLQQRIFECAMCKSGFIHKSGISTHLAKEHGVPPKGNYIDRSDEHHEAILELVKKCFGKEEDK